MILNIVAKLKNYKYNNQASRALLPGQEFGHQGGPGTYN